MTIKSDYELENAVRLETLQDFYKSILWDAITVKRIKQVLEEKIRRANVKVIINPDDAGKILDKYQEEKKEQ